MFTNFVEICQRSCGSRRVFERSTAAVVLWETPLLPSLARDIHGHAKTGFTLIEALGPELRTFFFLFTRRSKFLSVSQSVDA